MTRRAADGPDPTPLNYHHFSFGVQCTGAWLYTAMNVDGQIS
ncbi:hypothetical protein QFZ65_002482 [Arthrobacter sp. B3I9]|nr:hypothetical protein [Arthrobacter sp. B3I9]MDQ0850544.1 hypothetical protein [Arthrobacter sp. B3I9]